MSDFIPVSEPWMSGAEQRLVCECLASGWVSSEGPWVSRFEAEFAARAGRAFGVAVTNGTAALEAALAALGIGAGDEVVLPDFTIISCAAAVVRAGAVPVLVDADPVTWNLDVAQVEARLGPRTRAVMPVHIYGLPVDMDPLLELAARKGLRVVEDAAEAHGLQYRGRPCGSFGDLSTFSFYPNKLITTGEGGMVVTDDAALAERCRSLRNLCFQAARRFVHEELGWNYRFSSLQAALGLAQLEAFDERLARKARIGAWYEERLRDVAWLQRPALRTSYAENGYWAYGVVLHADVPFDAAAAMDRLKAAGIGARPFFWPLHEQPVFRDEPWAQAAVCPVASRLARRGFYLPSGMGLTEAQVDRVCAAVRALHPGA